MSSVTRSGENETESRSDNNIDGSGMGTQLSTTSRKHYERKDPNMRSTQWTISRLLVHTSAVNGTEGQWFQYIKHYLYQPLQLCQMQRHDTIDCSSFRSTIRDIFKSLAGYFASLAYSTGTELNMNVRCKAYHQGENVLLYQLGSVRFFGNCSLAWIIKVNPIFSINITITEETDWQIMEATCSPTYTRYRSRCRCTTSLLIYERYPMWSLLERACGYIPEQSVMVSGHEAHVSLWQAHIIDTYVGFSFMYVIIEKLHHSEHDNSELTWTGEMYIDHRRYTSLLPDAVDSVIWTRTIGIWIWGISVALMWRADITIMVSCTSTRLANADALIFMIDGPVSPHDGYYPFLRQDLQQGYRECPYVSKYSKQSTLNEVTVIMSRSRSIDQISFNITYVAVPMNCPSTYCNSEIHKIIPNTNLHHRISSADTHIFNKTYTLDTVNNHHMTYNISQFLYEGFYSMLCKFGSVTVLYKENMHDLHHVILGTYCSPGAIEGLFGMSDPLIVDKGSLSIVVKTYQHVTSIDLTYVISTTDCTGTVDTYLFRRYVHNLLSFDEDLNKAPVTLWKETRFIYTIDVTVFVRSVHVRGITISFIIVRSPAECLCHQFIATDIFKESYATLDDMYRIDIHFETQTDAFHSKHTDVSISLFHGNNIEFGDMLDRRKYLLNRSYLMMTILSVSQAFSLRLHVGARVKYDQMVSLSCSDETFGFHALGLSLKFQFVESSKIGYKIPVYVGVRHRIYQPTATVSLLSKQMRFPAVFQLAESVDIQLLLSNRMSRLPNVYKWDVLFYHGHTDNVYNIIATDKCKSLLDVMRTYTPYWYTVSVYGGITTFDGGRQQIYNEYIQPLPAKVVSHSTRFLGQQGIVITVGDQYWNDNCTINIVSTGISIGSYSGIPQYQLLQLDDLTRINQWRMCRQGTCYLLRDELFYPQPSTWEEAETFCHTQHGELLSINSGAEEATVFDWIEEKYFPNNPDEHYGKLPLYLPMKASMIYIGLKSSDVSVTFIQNRHVN